MPQKTSYDATDLIFDIDTETADFIEKRYRGDITIAMDFHPMMDSGWKCSATREVVGCYVPRIYAGAPGNDENAYRHGQTANVQVFYSPRLRSKLESNHIRIRIKRFLFFRWLELEDASSIVRTSAEQ